MHIIIQILEKAVHNKKGSIPRCSAVVKAAANVTEGLCAKVIVKGAKENINFNIVKGNYNDWDLHSLYYCLDICSAADGSEPMATCTLCEGLITVYV